MSAKVYLVGAGPGSSDHLTIKAARLLGQADVVLYDALVCQDVLDFAPQARKICVGKRSGQPSTEQGFINRLLVASARTSNVVVRLKGGDPMVFGRAHEEISACHAAGLEVEVVPGVSAALAAAAHVQTSLTRRGVSKSLTFVTPAFAASGAEPHGGENAWADAVAAAQTSVLYMGASQARPVVECLLARGVSPNLPVVIVQDAGRTHAKQIAGCLEDLPRLTLELDGGPAIVLMGDVFADLHTLARDVFEPKPALQASRKA